MNVIIWQNLFFWFFALVACAFAVAVVVAGNIVRMACYLIVSAAAVAGLFFLAGADFLGAAQLMVYVGGTMVLVVFGVMLTARGPFVSMKTGGGQWVLAILVGGALLVVLVQAAFKIPEWSAPPSPRPDQPAVMAPTAEPIGYALLGMRPDGLEKENTAGMSGYLLPFEIISIHLVVVLIGAAYLARAKRRVAQKRGPEARDWR
jgi:NADH-quinone oxidoreductase subunit J